MPVSFRSAPERIARDLRVSARTLRRRLGALGTSFQELLEDVRRGRAIAYLVESEVAVEQISVQLGYGDPANFRRAFRRWEGVAPSTYRAERRAAAQGLPPERAPDVRAKAVDSPARKATDDRAWPARPLPADAE
ncbi:MAG: hypothetical protein RLZZ450_6312 [Pseudomonadota bacterium]|jgi:AraC-like DNA-binding protein